MDYGEIEWAGVRFLPLYHHDARFFRCPGVWAFVRREVSGDRTLLYVDHTDNIASAVAGHRLWSEALGLGLNELNISLKAVDRVDRLLLKGHIVKRCEPLLNLLDEAAQLRAGSAQIRHRAANRSQSGGGHKS